MDIIKIFDNIFLSSELVTDEIFINGNNIKEIILVELDTDQIVYDESLSCTYKINIMSNPPVINFDHTNDIIISSLSNSSGNILIVSKDNLLGFIVIMGFMIKYLKVSMLDCLIFGINKNIKGLNKSVFIKHLNEYNLYVKNDNLL